MIAAQAGRRRWACRGWATGDQDVRHRPDRGIRLALNVEDGHQHPKRASRPAGPCTERPYGLAKPDTTCRSAMAFTVSLPWSSSPCRTLWR